jgi:hypothetical protein
VSQVKIGFVNIPASLVLEYTTQALADLKARKVANTEAFVQRFVDSPMGWFRSLLRRKPMTREDAIKLIKDDTWLGHEYWWIAKYVSPKEEALEKLRTVADYTTGDMTIAIEVANWFYQEPTKS